MMRACRKAVTALAVCSAVLAVISIEPVSAQTPCDSMSASMNVCGRTYQWRAVPNGLYVLRCPATSQGLQGGSVMIAGFGSSGDPDWRACADYDTASECEIGKSQIWLHRGGPGGPQLQANKALTLSARKAAQQFPFCAPQFSPACDSCSTSVNVQFIFDDAAGFLTVPAAKAESLAPTCSADGASVVGQQSIRLAIHLDAPPAEDPSSVYAGYMNLDGNAGFQGQETASGAKLSNFRTGTGQSNTGAMNVLLVDQAGAGTIATVENVAFNANGDATITVPLPAEYSSKGAANLNLNVVLRSRTTGLSSAFSAAVPVTLQACIPPPPPVVSTPAPTTPVVSEPAPTTQPQSGGQEVDTPTDGGLVAVPDNTTPVTTTPETTTPVTTTPVTTTPVTTTPVTTTPVTTTPVTTTPTTGNSGNSGSTTPATSTPSTTNPSQGNAQDGDVNVGASPSGAAVSGLRNSVLAVAVAAASAALMILA